MRMTKEEFISKMLAYTELRRVVDNPLQEEEQEDILAI
jgi:hypothetical protein